MSLRKKRHEEHENHERWLVSYADFITLLFAFFVVLYATSNNDHEKQKSFEESVRASLKLGAMSMGQGGGGETIGSVIPELANPIENFPKRGGPAEVQDFIERQFLRVMTKEEMQKAGIEVRRDAQGARIALAADLYYPTGDTKLKRSGLEALGTVADILNRSERKIVVEGHTDDTASPSQPSNWEFASLRATSLVRYLVNHRSFSAGRVSAASFADSRPLVPNTNEENRARNRRIEILVTADPAEE